MLFLYTVTVNAVSHKCTSSVASYIDDTLYTVNAVSHKCTSSVASYIDDTLYTAMCICSLFTSDKNNQRGIDQTFEFSIESQEGLALSTLNVCSLSKLIGFTFGAA